MSVRNVDLWGSPTVVPSGQLTVLCVDPGGVTGFVWCTVTHEQLLLLGVSVDLFAQMHVSSGGGSSSMGFGQYHSLPIAPNTMDSLFGLEDQVVSRLLDGAQRLHARVPGGLTHVVIEDFIVRIRTQDRSLLSPVRITAMLYYALNHHEPHMLVPDELSVSVHMQQPGIMSTVSDEQLERLGVYWRGQEHARAATKHLVVFLRRYLEALRSL